MQASLHPFSEPKLKLLHQKRFLGLREKSPFVLTYSKEKATAPKQENVSSGYDNKALLLYTERKSSCKGDYNGEALAITERRYSQVQLQSALKTFQQALAKAQANNDCVSQVNILKHIGLFHCHLGQYAWGVKCLEQALQIAQKIGLRATAGVILSYMGLAYRQTGQHSKALQVYLQALAIFKAIANEAGIARTLNDLGETYNNLGQPERAIWCCRQALKLFQNLGYLPEGEGTALHNIGEAYLQLGRPRQAIALLEQALAIRQKINACCNSQATTLESIGTAYVRVNKDLQALEFFNQALEIRRQVGHSPNAEAKNLDYMGAIHYKLGNPSRALWYHLQALGLLQTGNNNAARERFFSDNGDSERLLHPLIAAYERFNLHKEGRKCYKEALEIVKTFGEKASVEAIQHYFEEEGQ